MADRTSKIYIKMGNYLEFTIIVLVKIDLLKK